MDGIYENIGEYNPNKQHKIFILFDDIIIDMLSNKTTLTNSSRNIYHR